MKKKLVLAAVLSALSAKLQTTKGEVRHLKNAVNVAALGETELSSQPQEALEMQVVQGNRATELTDALHNLRQCFAAVSFDNQNVIGKGSLCEIKHGGRKMFVIILPVDTFVLKFGKKNINVLSYDNFLSQVIMGKSVGDKYFLKRIVGEIISIT